MILASFIFYLTSSASLLLPSKPARPRLFKEIYQTKLDAEDIGDKSAIPIANYLALFTVPLCWGTYSPLVKSLYSSSARDISPLVFNFSCYLVSLLSTLFVLFWSKKSNKLDYLKLRQGLELGVIIFLGSTLQVMGIQNTSASKASILVQLTTILVPIFQSFLDKKKISRVVWLSCVVAFLGASLIIAGDPLESGRFSFSEGIISGDILICGSAVFYALHVVRLGIYSTPLSAIPLSVGKCASELILSLVAMSLVDLSTVQGTTTFETLSNLLRFTTDNQFFYVVVLWNGVVTTAYTTWAQYFGQQRVSATVANLFYTLQPLWSTIFATIFLHESISGNAVFGALLVFISIGLASSYSESKS